MTPAEAIQFIPLLQAYGEGKMIQRFSIRQGGWVDTNEIDLHNPPHEYRIKPEPKVVPWTFETCPVGAVVKTKNGRECLLIVQSDQHGVRVAVDHVYFNYSELLNMFTLLDGSPCGSVVG